MDTSTANEVRLLTITETCALLRLPRSTIYVLISSKRIKSYKVGKRRLIPATAINDFVRQLSDE
jgi:excisionase family DNA binding protein